MHGYCYKLKTKQCSGSHKVSKLFYGGFATGVFRLLRGGCKLIFVGWDVVV
jgi:hypothetical protein